MIRAASRESRVTIPLGNLMQPLSKKPNQSRTKTYQGDFSPPLSILLFEDELIRQVCVNCAERGLLLLRVRDELQMTIAAYQTLYESGVVFGMRKALQAEQDKVDMLQRVSNRHILHSFDYSSYFLIG